MNTINQTATKPWLSEVLDLSRTLCTAEYDLKDAGEYKYVERPAESTREQIISDDKIADVNDNHVARPALGDFHKVWEFLGFSNSVPPATSLTFAENLSSESSPVDEDHSSEVITRSERGRGETGRASTNERKAEEATDGSWTSTTAASTVLAHTKRRKQRRRQKKPGKAEAQHKSTSGTNTEAGIEHGSLHSKERRTLAISANVETEDDCNLQHLGRSYYATDGADDTFSALVELATGRVAEELKKLKLPQPYGEYNGIAISQSGNSIGEVSSLPLQSVSSRVNSQDVEFDTRSRGSPPSSQLIFASRNEGVENIADDLVLTPSQKHSIDPLPLKREVLKGTLQEEADKSAHLQNHEFTTEETEDSNNYKANRKINNEKRVSSEKANTGNTNANKRITIGNDSKATRDKTSTRIAHTSKTKNVRQKYVIEPKLKYTTSNRNWALLQKLVNSFSEDKSRLVNPKNLITHSSHDSGGIHVFVDASNIFIGFTDRLRRSRGIPESVKLPQAKISFDALALLMERGRPVAKRVLVGSTPHISAFDVAKAIGYECSILEKVFKARELTDRQMLNERDQTCAKSTSKPILAVPQFGFPNHGRGNIIHETMSGPGQARTPQYGPKKNIEQAVDEVLHLKIAESIFDFEPSTIVLATGDAAEAEYSGGFLAMVVRALRYGWKVELVSWKKSLSSMYRRSELFETGRFRIIFLDEYAEELLDT